ncbi:MAG: DUF302 domain-containing protein [Cuniculiplasma sp.]
MTVEMRLKSKEDFETLCSKVPEVVSKNGFAVLAEIRTGDILKSKGFDYGPLRTYEICNPAYAFRILSADEKFESLLPCRIVLKGKPEGTEVIGLLPEALSELVDSTSVKDVAHEVQEKIKKIVGDIAK